MTRPSVQLATAAALLMGVTGACSGNRENRSANNSARESTDTTARSDARDTGPTGAAASTGQTLGTGTVTVGQIASNPSQYVGQRVTVRADVGSAVGQNAFTLTEGSASGSAAAGGSAFGTTTTGSAGTSGAGSGSAAGSTGRTGTAAIGNGPGSGLTGTDTRQLLVISPSGFPTYRRDLTISGTVRMFTSLADLRRDAPWLSSSASGAQGESGTSATSGSGSTGSMSAGGSASTGDLNRYQNQPVVIADSIRTADGRELVTTGGALPAGSGELGRAGSGTGNGSRSGSGGSDRP